MPDEPEPPVELPDEPPPMLEPDPEVEPEGVSLVPPLLLLPLRWDLRDDLCLLVEELPVSEPEPPEVAEDDEPPPLDEPLPEPDMPPPVWAKTLPAKGRAPRRIKVAKR